MLDHILEPPRVVRRLEVITGVGGRRRWSASEKARIIEEAISPDAVVSEVARRHGMSPQHLFSWLRAARRDPAPAQRPPTTLFVPAVVEAVPKPEPCSPAKTRRRRRQASTGAGIELEIDGVVVRVGAGASPKAIAAVIRALKAGP
jgi:transposase